jgi:hypothetical protein
MLEIVQGLFTSIFSNISAAKELTEIEACARRRPLQLPRVGFVAGDASSW